jgi:formate-dependent nitrite reductase cytochrome c552 subunit
MDCHQPAACGMHRVLGPKIAENCIDCHMPRTQHTDVEMMVKRGVTIESADHFIRIDQASTDEYLAR